MKVQKAPPPPLPKNISDLIAKFESTDFNIREQATNDLIAAAQENEEVYDQLQALLSGGTITDAEQINRINTILSAGKLHLDVVDNKLVVKCYEVSGSFFGQGTASVNNGNVELLLGDRPLEGFNMSEGTYDKIELKGRSEGDAVITVTVETQDGQGHSRGEFTRHIKVKVTK